ncbi:hypothetical protein GYMLUDRAFT_240372 [Collybiopsis luxurians FD-317 M1]|nr:hypothetical protein GYMLUDRAFT_240372 [Collybiopsis luxurians FD-317 M1]
MGPSMVSYPPNSTKCPHCVALEHDLRLERAKRVEIQCELEQLIESLRYENSSEFDLSASISGVKRSISSAEERENSKVEKKTPEFPILDFASLSQKRRKLSNPALALSKRNDLHTSKTSLIDVAGTKGDESNILNPQASDAPSCVLFSTTSLAHLLPVPSYSNSERLDVEKTTTRHVSPESISCTATQTSLPPSHPLPQPQASLPSSNALNHSLSGVSSLTPIPSPPPEQHDLRSSETGGVDDERIDDPPAPLSEQPTNPLWAQVVARLLRAVYWSNFPSGPDICLESQSRTLPDDCYGDVSLMFLWHRSSPWHLPEQRHPIRPSLFLLYEQNPDLPVNPAEPGVFLTAREDILKMQPAGGVRFFIGYESDRKLWKYVGDYELVKCAEMTGEQFSLQPRETQERFANIILHQREDCEWLSMHARISLRKRRIAVTRNSVSEERVKIIRGSIKENAVARDLTVQDVIDALAKGDEHLCIIRVECDNYDHAFVSDLRSQYKIWLAKSVLNPHPVDIYQETEGITQVKVAVEPLNDN